MAQVAPGAAGTPGTASNQRLGRVARHENGPKSSLFGRKRPKNHGVGGQNPSHPLFVFRSTLALLLAFLFGWVGLERAMPAYSYGAAVTVSVVVANTGQSGFSLGLIMTRLNSAVIGTVIGQAAQQVLAVQTSFHASLFALFIWVFTWFLIFQILHSQSHGATALPILAIGIGSLVPQSGVFRVYNAQIEPEAEISLATSVKSTVFGGRSALPAAFFMCLRHLRCCFR